MKAFQVCTLGLCGMAALASPSGATPKGADAAKLFKNAAKGNDTAKMVEAAEEMANDPTKKGVEVMIKVGAMIEHIDVYIACRDALSAATSGKARDALIKGLVASKRLEQRVLCADALGGAPDMGSVKALSQALTDKEKPVRIAAIRALNRIERKECVPLLFKRLDKVGGKSGDAEAEELYASLFNLTGQSFETLVDWEKYWETVKADFDPKERAKNDTEAITRQHKGEGKIFDSVIRSQQFVLILDISSSMRVIDLPPGKKWKDKKGKSHNYKDPDPTGRKKPVKESRFERAREAFVRFIEGLGKRCFFTIIVFADEKETKAWKPKPVPATKANKKAAVMFVKGLRWGYATRTDVALERAFEIPDIDSIYMYTDGIPEKRTGGKSTDIPVDDILLKAKTLNRARKVKINCYQMANSKELRAFLRKLAKENGGEYRDIRVR